jgi:hypothetical protein
VPPLLAPILVSLVLLVLVLLVLLPPPLGRMASREAPPAPLLLATGNISAAAARGTAILALVEGRGAPHRWHDDAEASSAGEGGAEAVG